MAIYGYIKRLFRNNGKVVENYVFMTVLQVLNMCFYLIVYPVLISRLGDTGFGTYVFAWSVTCIFMAAVNFGFDMPCAKHIARIVAEGGSRERLGEVLAAVQTAKILLEALVTLVFVVLLLTVPFMRDNRLVFAVGFAQTLSCILFPQWYFQGVQRMRVVTFIQLAGKLLTLPFIFLLLHTPDDVWLFMLINTVASLLGAVAAWLLVRFKDGVPMPLVPVRAVVPYCVEATPFFLTNVMAIAKEQGVVLLTGSFLGMADVAVYDLANKIVTVPRIMLLKLNEALFPKIVVSSTPRQVRRIMYAEALLGLAVVALVAAVGKWLVLWLGHGQLPMAYPVSVILSTTVLFWLLGTAFIDFVFIPANRRYLVTANQVVALVTCLAAVFVWLFLRPSVYGVAAGLALSGMCEVVFCAVVTYKERLLQLKKVC
ncbi:MAG: oligosaccharide flippase family protein [Paludibacteraceae bacterium]|nr:oligosaccharide flippase family protein [Paludibacteraceae bacterium]